MLHNDLLDQLTVATEPWLLRSRTSPSDLTDLLSAWEQGADQRIVRFLRGGRMRTVEALFDEFAAALQFPYYFGGNWAAFDECLTDLSWLPGSAYAVVIFDAELLLADAPEDREVLFRYLEAACVTWGRPVSVGEPWDRQAVPFHVVLQTADG